MPTPVDLSQAIEQAANTSGQRFSIGPAPTFGQRTIPQMLPSFLPQIDAESLNFSSVDVSVSGSAALVTAGSAKPVAATVTITPRQIQKVAAYAVINAENYWQSEEVITSVIATLFSSCASEQDKLANTALGSAAGTPIAATSWIEGIAAGQSQVNAQSGQPNLVVIPAASWPDLAAELASSTGFTTPSNEAILSVLGSRIVLSPEGTNALVLDPSAAVRAVRDYGFLIDSSSGSVNNKINIVVDDVSSVFVQIPQFVAAFTVTVGP